MRSLSDSEFRQSGENMHKFLVLIFVFTSLLSTHVRAEIYQYAVIGDAGKWNAESMGVRDSILNEKVTFWPVNN